MSRVNPALAKVNDAALVTVDHVVGELVEGGTTDDACLTEALTFILVELVPGLLAAAVGRIEELVAGLEDVDVVRLLVDNSGLRDRQQVKVVPHAVDEVQNFRVAENALDGELLLALLGFSLLDNRATGLLVGLLEGAVLRADVVVLVALLDGLRTLVRTVAAVDEHDTAVFIDEGVLLDLLPEVREDVGVDDAAHVKGLAQLAVALVPLLADAGTKPAPQRVQVFVEVLAVVPVVVAEPHLLTTADLVVFETLGPTDVAVVVEVVAVVDSLTLHQELVEVRSDFGTSINIVGGKQCIASI